MLNPMVTNSGMPLLLHRFFSKWSGFFLSLYFGLFSCVSADDLNASQSSAITIEAKTGFTCDLKTNTCVGSGGVITKRDDSILTSQSLEAKVALSSGSKEKQTSQKEQDFTSLHNRDVALQELTARGNVVFRKQNGVIVAKGSEAIYNVRTEELRFYGKPTISQGKATLMTGKYLVFYGGAKMAQAIGRSTFRYDDKLVQADQIRIYFYHDDARKLMFDRLEASGNVILSTKTEMATAQKGVYRARAKQIELFNDVMLTRQEGHLKGQYARYDLQTGRSIIKNSIGPAFDGASTGSSSRQSSTDRPNRVRIVLEPEVTKGALER